MNLAAQSRTTSSPAITTPNSKPMIEAFGNVLNYTVSSDQVGGFDLYVRVPSWSAPGQSSISIQGRVETLQPNHKTGLHKITLPYGTSNIVYTIGTIIRAEERANNTVSVYYGNMLYALDVGQVNSTSNPHGYLEPEGPELDLPFPKLKDYDLQNEEKWNIAIDPSTLKYHGLPEGGELPNPVFDYYGGTYISVEGCEIYWDLYLGATPGPPPPAGNRSCIGERDTYKLIPYGQAKVHMSELPTIDRL